MDNRQEKGFTAFAAPVSSVPMADSGGGLTRTNAQRMARPAGHFFRGKRKKLAVLPRSVANILRKRLKDAAQACH